METKKYICEEGKSNEKRPEPKETEMNYKNESETERALKIILGIEETTSQTMNQRILEDSSLIKRAKEFRIEFEKMKGV